MNTERINYQDEKIGMIVHAIVTLGVSALVTVINLTVCPQFLWLFFTVAGMSIGLSAHYFFGYRRARKAALEA